ncbi:dihydrofolate reductase [Candidatus Micrarchaeota archaeon]|nr:dihydrofolate reductase [Candidatus Micrarchaeota archaeon]
MSRCLVYIATSLDGYIAKKGGELGWLEQFPNPDGSDFGFEKFIQGIDAIVMGRKTFEKVLEFERWPYKKPVFVISTTIKNIPKKLEKQAELIHGKPNEILERLAKRKLNSIYIDGGKTIQSFLAEDLIDELTITRVPIILGDGIPLFVKTDKEIEFEHVKTEVYKNGLVKSYYRRNR